MFQLLLQIAHIGFGLFLFTAFGQLYAASSEQTVETKVRQDSQSVETIDAPKNSIKPTVQFGSARFFFCNQKALDAFRDGSGRFIRFKSLDELSPKQWAWMSMFLHNVLSEATRRNGDQTVALDVAKIPDLPAPFAQYFYHQVLDNLSENMELFESSFKKRVMLKNLLNKAKIYTTQPEKISLRRFFQHTTQLESLSLTEPFQKSTQDQELTFFQGIDPESDRFNLRFVHVSLPFIGAQRIEQIIRTTMLDISIIGYKPEEDIGFPSHDYIHRNRDKRNSQLWPQDLRRLDHRSIYYRPFNSDLERDWRKADISKIARSQTLQMEITEKFFSDHVSPSLQLARFALFWLQHEAFQSLPIYGPHNWITLKKIIPPITKPEKRHLIQELADFLKRSEGTAYLNELKQEFGEDALGKFKLKTDGGSTTYDFTTMAFTGINSLFKWVTALELPASLSS